MISEDPSKVAEVMLHEFSAFCVTLGGLDFYGKSPEFSDLLAVCSEFASLATTQPANPRKAYIFIEPHHGKTSLAKAIDIEAKSKEMSSYYFNGTVGLTQKELKDLQPKADVLVLVDGIPEAAASRRVLLERFNGLSGRALLFATPQYYAEANLDETVPKMKLSHVDMRHIDKLAWLIGTIRENLRDDSGIISKELADAITRLPSKALASLSSVPLGSRIAELPILGRRIAEALRIRAKLEPGQPFPQVDLSLLFMEGYSLTVGQDRPVFRVWVEGDSDCQILKLVSKLAGASHKGDLEEGLLIVPLGSGREGGTAKTIEIVLSKQTKKNNDLFLLDFDAPGRHSAEDLRTLEQDVMLLDPKLSCSRSDSDVEIEDFIGLACLDRFYKEHPERRPEKEIVRYKAPTARRLVVDGADKEALVLWLEANASLCDLENLFYVLCDIRNRFSLRGLVSPSEMHAWKKRLAEEYDVGKHLGNRPAHWT